MAVHFKEKTHGAGLEQHCNCTDISVFKTEL